MPPAIFHYEESVKRVNSFLFFLQVAHALGKIETETLGEKGDCSVGFLG